jgi:hypothetical protein
VLGKGASSRARTFALIASLGVGGVPSSAWAQSPEPAPPAPPASAPQPAGTAAPTTPAPGASTTATLQGLGIVSLVLGPVLVIGGLGDWVDQLRDSGGSEADIHPDTTRGLVVASVGVVLLFTGGILLHAASRRAKATPQPPAAVLVVPGDPWTLSPTWREPPAEGRGVPPALGVPLWSGRF